MKLASVDDRLPEDFDLTVAAWDGKRWWLLVQFENESGQWFLNDEYGPIFIDGVTHWVDGELPPPDDPFWQERE